MKHAIMILAIGWMMLSATGCVERKLTVTSDPPGALVTLNDQEIGRTPFEKDFTWYGVYYVAVRKEGYRTLKTSADVIAPAYQWPPIDLVAEVLPLKFKDNHTLTFNLEPELTAPADTDALMARAQAMKQDLEASEHTTLHAPPIHAASTRPTTMGHATTRP